MLCYPNSPTGKTAPPEFYERAIAFAKKHEIVIVQDAAHGMLSYDRAPNSFLADARAPATSASRSTRCRRAST